MKVYRVGGAVRDRLLGRPVEDVDWVVVGSTPEEMERLGYRRVGRDFPVFLHPETGEEYALARTERKAGRGYHGFTFDTAPTVTLEEDLRRRDLTINAMAEDADGRLVDPFGGRRDLERGVLRHVSEAFVEDPLRVLRVARFAARLNFVVAPGTMALMRRIAASGELDTLTPERVWTELDRALGEPWPRRFVEVLRDARALAAVLPEVDALFGVPQPLRFHPEIDTGAHLLLALDVAASLEADAPTRFAVLVHDLGKAHTDPQRWPAHHGHEQRGADAIEALCNRLKAPREYRRLAVTVARRHTEVHRAGTLEPERVLALIEAADGLRRPAMLQRVLMACEADARGRAGLRDRPYPQRRALLAAREAAAAVSAKALVERGLQGPAVGERLRSLRVAAVAAALGGS